MATSRTKSSKTSAKSAATTNEPIARVALPTVDAISALAAAQHVRDQLADDKTAARFRSLPPKEFDVRVLDTYPALVGAADAAWRAYASASAASSDALVPLSLAQSGLTIKTRMLACASHNLEGIEDAEHRIDVIRPGTGHLDLVGDLIGLASLYTDYEERLSKDGNKYKSSDAADANHVAAQMQAALLTGHNSAAKTAGKKWARAFAKLRAPHDEIIPTGRWLDRKTDDAVANWPSLFTSLRQPSKKPKKTTAAATPAKTNT